MAKAVLRLSQAPVQEGPVYTCLFFFFFLKRMGQTDLQGQGRSGKIDVFEKDFKGMVVGRLGGKNIQNLEDPRGL